MEIIFELIFIILFYSVCYPIGKIILSVFFRNIKISNINDDEAPKRDFKKLKITYSIDDVKCFHSDTVVFTGFIFVILLVVIIGYIWVKSNL